MDVRETFYRGEELGREARKLPAVEYNLSHLMLTKSKQSCLFVPIRSMQYLAVIDDEEIIFVDAINKRIIQFAWKYFTPQTRESLTDPVSYTLVYYQPGAIETMKRLQGEYFKALKILEARLPETASSDSNIIQIPKK